MKPSIHQYYTIDMDGELLRVKAYFKYETNNKEHNKDENYNSLREITFNNIPMIYDQRFGNPGSTTYYLLIKSLERTGKFVCKDSQDNTYVNIVDLDTGELLGDRNIYRAKPAIFSLTKSIEDTEIVFDLNLNPRNASSIGKSILFTSTKADEFNRASFNKKSNEITIHPVAWEGIRPLDHVQMMLRVRRTSPLQQSTSSGGGLSVTFNLVTELFIIPPNNVE